MANIEWTEADKAMVAKIAGEVVEKVMEHCPYVQQYKLDKRFLLGAMVGSGLLGAGGAAGFMSAFLGG